MAQDLERREELPAMDQEKLEKAIRQVLLPLHRENIRTSESWRTAVDLRLDDLEDKARKLEEFQLSQAKSHGQMLGYFDQLLGSPHRPQIQGLIPQIIADAKEKDAKDSKRWHTLNNSLQSLIEKDHVRYGERVGRLKVRGWVKWVVTTLAALLSMVGAVETAKKLLERHLH